MKHFGGAIAKNDEKVFHEADSLMINDSRPSPGCETEGEDLSDW